MSHSRNACQSEYSQSESEYYETNPYESFTKDYHTDLIQCCAELEGIWNAMKEETLRSILSYVFCLLTYISKRLPLSSPSSNLKEDVKQRS